MISNEYKFIPHGFIYQYRDIPTCKLILESGKLKFENPRKFNDPFDCNISIFEFSINEPALKEVQEAFKLQVKFPKNLKREYYNTLINDPNEFSNLWQNTVEAKINACGVACFSKRFDNTLMWSYYADKHKGVCLEFDSEIPYHEILLDVQPDVFVTVNYERIDKIDYNIDKREAIIELVPFLVEIRLV